VGGRIVDEHGSPVSGGYCAGWIKRGPTGVIGTNKKDAAETVEALLADARSGALPRQPGASAEAVDALLAERGVEVVTYGGWQLIDKLECERGAPHGRPRIKLTRWDELLEAARG
jgi:ferredoxin/flavodoxin---NADP+ reductase